MTFSIGNRIMSLFLAVGRAADTKLIEHRAQLLFWCFVEHLQIVEPQIITFERIDFIVESESRLLLRLYRSRNRSRGHDYLLHRGGLEQGIFIDVTSAAIKTTDTLVADLNT